MTEPKGICPRCGHHATRHEEDPYSGDLKCPIFRQEKTTPPGEYYSSPRGDY